MREILFRGKTKDTGEWVVGTYLPKAKKSNACIMWCEDDYIMPKMKAIIPETVEQYTGLTDNNGKKIFEGDICRFYGDEKYSDYEVFFTTEASNSQAVGFYIRQLDTGAIDSFDNFFAVNCEVIGNIHDNPELLKESED